MSAPTQPNFTTDQQAGIDFTQTYTINVSAPTSAGYAPEVPNAPYSPGELVEASNGGIYIFCKLAASIKKWSAVYIDQAFNCGPLTNTQINIPGFQVGFAQVAATFQSSTIPTYLWVAIKGENLGVLARQGSLANAQLYLSAVSAGVLTTTSIRSTSGYPINGVVLTQSSLSAPSAVTKAYAMWPRSNLN